MTVLDFLNNCTQYDGKYVAIVCQDGTKLSGILKMPATKKFETLIELFNVTHYAGYHIIDYSQYSIPIEKIDSIYIE